MDSIHPSSQYGSRGTLPTVYYTLYPTVNVPFIPGPNINPSKASFHHILISNWPLLRRQQQKRKAQLTVCQWTNVIRNWRLVKRGYRHKSVDGWIKYTLGARESVESPHLATNCTAANGTACFSGMSRNPISVPTTEVPFKSSCAAKRR